MRKTNPLEHGAAAGAAMFITLTVVWAFATLGYPSPADAAAKAGIAASTLHCRSG